MLSLITPTFSWRIAPDADIKLIIPIPHNKQWLHLPILIYWLMGWILGELATVDELNHRGWGGDYDIFLIWAVLWTAGGIYALLDLLWQLWGHQALAINSTFLTNRYSLFGLGRTRRYDLARIQNIHVTSRLRSGWYSSKITFDYGTRTVQISAGADEIEAKQIAKTIRKSILS